MNWPKHLSLHISHNDHKSYYESIEDYLQRDHLKDDILPEDRAEILKTDSIWEVQWYPITPIGSYYVAAATLERCMEIINSQVWR